MPDPIWKPDVARHRPKICDFIVWVNDRHGVALPEGDFQALHAWSMTQGELFWDALWDFCGVLGDKGDTIIQALDHPPYARFFPKGKLNYTENMLAYWDKNPDETAMIYTHQDGPDILYSGAELIDAVSLWEQALRGAGIDKGDVVGLYLPNIPESDIILMAVANIGAVLCSAGMEMGADDLVSRFEAAAPKILITTGDYNYGDKVIDRTGNIEQVRTRLSSLEQVVILDLDSTVKVDHAFLSGYEPAPLVFERHDFNQPLYILFSSGSTGKPKCFVHGAGGVLLKHLSEYVLQADIAAGDRIFFHATPSWMMWNWAASALAVGATLLKFSGHPFYPSADVQLLFTLRHGCTHHGTAAPVIMGWRDQHIDLLEQAQHSDLRSVLYTGAVLPSQGFDYLDQHIKKGLHISGISGGTDLVGCFLYGNPLTPVYAGQIAGATLGCDIQIWDDEARLVPDDEMGELVCANAFPSMPLYFLGDDDHQRYFEAYYEFYNDKGHKVWRHGDTVMRTPEGQIVIVGRSDGTLNQNGVRIGSIAIYNQLDPFADQISGAAAVDFTRPDTKQSITVLFLALKDGSEAVPDDLQKAIKAAVKNNVGPYSVPTEMIAAPDVLRTKNGKLAEVVMKKILAGANIENSALYGEDLVNFYEEIAKKLQSKYA